MHSYIFNLQRSKENRNADEKMDENYIAKKDDILNNMNLEGASADYVEECKGNDLKSGEKVLKALGSKRTPHERKPQWQPAHRKRPDQSICRQANGTCPKNNQSTV